MRAICVPEPKDKRGYTFKEINSILTKDERKKWNKWFFGQTCGYDSKTKTIFVYSWDLQRFLNTVRNGAPDVWD